MFHKATAIFAAAALALPLSAAELIPVSPLNESLGEQAKISGNVVVGFMSLGTAPEEKPYVEALVPQIWKSATVCLTLVSQDGRYEAYGEYTVPPEWSGGLVSIPIKSNHDKYLSEIGRGQFAGMLSKGQCTKRGETVAPLGWNEKLNSLPPDVELLINSHASDEVYLVFEDGTDIDCVQTEAENHLAFDFTCTIPKAQFVSGEVIEINRVRRGRRARPHFVEVSASQ